MNNLTKTIIIYYFNNSNMMLMVVGVGDHNSFEGLPPWGSDSS